MELRRIDIVPPNCRGEPLAVFRPAGNNRGVRRLGKEAVDKIDETPVWNVFEERTIRLRHFNLVPADLRHFQTVAVKANHVASKNPQTGSAAIELLTFFE